MSGTNERIKGMEWGPGAGSRTRSPVRRITAAVLFALTSAVARVTEYLVALPVVLFLAVPCLVLLGMRKLLFRTDVFAPRDILGKGGNAVTVRFFNVGNPFIRTLALFFHLFSGTLRLVGPVIRRSDGRIVPGDNYILDEKPGILTLRFVRESSRTAYEGTFDTDWEYVFKKRPLYDLLLLLKTVPALFYHQGGTAYSARINLLGIPFRNAAMEDAVSGLRDGLRSKRRLAVYFVNPDCFNKAVANSEYHRVLRAADVVFPDGIGVTLACKIIKDPLVGNINGTDMLPYVCRMAAAGGYRLFLLGAKPGVAEKVRDNLCAQYAGLQVSGTQHGYFDRETGSAAVVERINRSRTDILLVAFGAPYQELWIHRYRETVHAGILMGVGGLFDFYSGTMPRAPRWMREIGLEWAYRLLQEPGRMWKRYVIGNPLFIYRVLRWRHARKG